MRADYVEGDHVPGWRQTLRRQWWVGIAIVCLTVGCGPVSNPLQSSVGLRPIPPYDEREYDYRYMGSLQPTLQWEAFPRQKDFKPDKAGRMPSITNVTYELRIWILYLNRLSGPVYSRDRLTAPKHKVEVPLAGHTTYYTWMVRAWFELNGRRRVTEWSVRYPPAAENHYNRRAWYRSQSNYYNFITFYN